MRKKFNEVFNQIDDNTLGVIRPTNIFGITIPTTRVVHRNTTFSGLDLFDFIGYDVEIDLIDGVAVFVGFWRDVGEVLGI